MEKENISDNGIFVFLSHSHRDYEKVRRVRDMLENEGFRPLMFFLKCLEKDECSEVKDEYERLTRKLIAEEIDSRKRFILCDSDNARHSDWVKFEVNRIKETNRPYQIIDLDWTENKIEERLKNYKRRSTVFLSYPRRLFGFVRVVNDFLKKNDFITWMDVEQISIGERFVEHIVTTLDDIIKKEGYVLSFFDNKTTTDCYIIRELEYTHSQNGNLIPVITSSELPPEIQFILDTNGYGKQVIDVANLPVNEAAEKIVNDLFKIDKQYNN